MMDQHSKVTPRGLTAEFVEAQTGHAAKRSLLRGEAQLVFITPESLIMQQWTLQEHVFLY